MRIAINQAEQAILSADRDQIARASLHCRTEQGTDLRKVAVVDVARPELVEPEEFAGLYIECDKRIGI